MTSENPNITLLTGDATEPVAKPALICHVCNDCVPGAWGAGFVLALSKKNRAPERAYRKWSVEGDGSYGLGAIQIVPFAENVWVSNMIAQKGIGYKNGIPLRYDALEECLKKTYSYAQQNNLSVHMPYIGCGLAGGSWSKVFDIINNVCIVPTYIYALPGANDGPPNP